MRDAAQQFQLRPAAVKAPVPQPCLIRGQQRHAPLSLAREHQKRLAFRPRHHHLAGRLVQFDLAQPAPPDRAFGPGLTRRRRALKPGGHRMAQPQFGRARQVIQRQNPARRTRGHDIAKAGLEQAFDGGEFRPRRDQHRPAARHVIADIVEIGRGQDAARAVAVKDDQVEFVDLVDEQFLRREGDQRQFRDRHAILFFGWAQDGEMHKIHRRVGFQQVAPCAFARMRLARDQQHPQPVAHTVDLDHGGIVAVGQLALGRGQFELHHVLPAMFQHQRQFQFAAHAHVVAARRATVDRDRQLRHLARRSGHLPLILDHQPDRGFLADDTKGGGGPDHQPSVPVARAPRQQQVQRRGQIGHQRGVMGLPVAQHDRPGHTRAGFGGQRLGQRGADPGARILGAVAQGDSAQFGVGQGLDLTAQRNKRRIGLRGAVRQALRGRTVVQKQHDIRQRLGLFALQRGLGNRGQQRQRSQPPQGPSTQPPPQRQRDQQPEPT